MLVRCYLFTEGNSVERTPVVSNGLVPQHPLLPDLQQQPSVQVRYLAVIILLNFHLLVAEATLEIAGHGQTVSHKIASRIV